MLERLLGLAKFQDFVTFVKESGKLVDNEFESKWKQVCHRLLLELDQPIRVTMLED